MKRTLFILLLAVCALGAWAQNPIRWRMSVEKLSDTEAVVNIKALIQEGWHLYGTKLPEGGPKATSFSFEGSEGIKLVGKMQPSAAPLNVDDPLFGLKLHWWEKDVVFSQKVKLVKTPGAKAVVTVSYMACDGNTCQPPKSQTLTYVFK